MTGPTGSTTLSGRWPVANVLESLVNHTSVINLAERQDRWEAVQGQLATIGYEKYERFGAYGVNHPAPERYTAGIADFKMSGWYGNKFSHYGVIDAARAAGHKAVMVFEDDVVFHPYFNRIISLALGQLVGQPWDWLQLGGNHRFFSGVDTQTSPIDGMPYAYPVDGLVQIAPNVARIAKMVTAHAYIARRSVYDFILTNAIKSPLSIDSFYGYEVHPRFICYSVTPCAARQAPGMNDIGGVYSDYSWYIGD